MHLRVGSIRLVVAVSGSALVLLLAVVVVVLRTHVTCSDQASNSYPQLVSFLAGLHPSEHPTVKYCVIHRASDFDASDKFAVIKPGTVADVVYATCWDAVSSSGSIYQTVRRPLGPALDSVGDQARVKSLFLPPNPACRADSSLVESVAVVKTANAPDEVVVEYSGH